MNRLVSDIPEDIAFGFDRNFLHNMSTEQRDFIDGVLSEGIVGLQ